MARRKRLPSNKVDFHFIKSNNFRVIHADGAWGGQTPSGSIAMIFYSERSPMPKRVVHELRPDGKLGPEISRDSRKGFVREAEVQIILSPSVAKSLIPWLERHMPDAKKEKELSEDNGGSTIQ